MFNIDTNQVAFNQEGWDEFMRARGNPEALRKLFNNIVWVSKEKFQQSIDEEKLVEDDKSKNIRQEL